MENAESKLSSKKMATHRLKQSPTCKITSSPRIKRSSLTEFFTCRRSSLKDLRPTASRKKNKKLASSKKTAGRTVRKPAASYSEMEDVLATTVSRQLSTLHSQGFLKKLRLSPTLRLDTAMSTRDTNSMQESWCNEVLSPKVDLRIPGGTA